MCVCYAQAAKEAAAAEKKAKKEAEAKAKAAEEAAEAKIMAEPIVYNSVDDEPGKRSPSASARALRCPVLRTGARWQSASSATTKPSRAALRLAATSSRSFLLLLFFLSSSCACSSSACHLTPPVEERADGEGGQVKTLGAEGGPAAGEEVWVRARVAGVRAKGGSCFLVLRDVQSAFHTVQVAPAALPFTLSLSVCA